MRLTMAARLWCGYGVIFLVLAAGSFFTIQTINDTKLRANAFTSEDMHFSLVAADMKLQAIQVQQWLTDVSATHDKAGYADSDEAMKNFNNGLEEFKAFYKSKNNTKGLQDLDKLDKAIKQLNADGHLMAETYLGKGLEAGNELMEIFDASSQTMAEALDPFIALQRAAAENSGKILNEDLTFINNLQFILLGAIILVGFLSSFIVITGLKRQLGAEPEEVAEVARKISSGDLDFEMKQLGFSGNSIYAAMSEMRAQLKASFADANACSLSAVEQADAARRAIEEARLARVAADNAKREGVLQATSSLGVVVKGLSDSSQQLSNRMDVVIAGSNEQVMRVSHASQAMNEMRSTIRDIAHSASSAAITADNAKRKALDGSGAVKEVISEISNAQSQTLRLKDDMAELGKQAQGIGQVLGVISDIADQTNLLALNAAIEAARAGDAGRGFAVVADEVRKLAEKTMVATNEVERVISNLQSGTTRNIDTVEKTVLIIQSATEKADNSGQALISIVELVDDTSGQVSAMAAASEEQGVASEQVSSSLEEIAHITEAAKIALSEASASYEELVKNTNAIRKVMSEMEASV